jgi:Rad3-related DNA helicase
MSASVEFNLTDQQQQRVAPVTQDAVADWHPHFPFAKPRPEQAAILDFVVANWDSTDDFFIQAPTGIGKSAVNQTIAELQAERGKATYISTTSLLLEDQYVGDFRSRGLRQLHAKSHYACPRWNNCAVGRQTLQPDHSDSQQGRLDIENTQDNLRRCNNAACNYLTAKSAFYAAQYSVANASFLITCARFLPRFPKRDLLIVDEGHTLGDEICRLYTVELPTSKIGPGIREGQELHWVKRHYLPELARALRCERHSLAKLKPNNPLLEKQSDKIRQLELQLANINAILASSPEIWVFDHQTLGDPRHNRLVISPLWPSPVARPLLQSLAPKRIFISATYPDFARQARWLGINPCSPRTKYLEVASPFPVEHRLIFSNPVIQWNHENPKPSWKTAALELERILAKHENERGLVHVSSYSQAKGIAELLGSLRLLTHDTSAERGKSLERMFATPGAVLISPSSREGLDLYGDRSQFQVIAKLPFASLGDKRVLTRRKEDPGWYALNTAQALLQAAGRSVRSNEDIAPTYVLDASWPAFLARHTRLFPSYFLDACRKERGY